MSNSLKILASVYACDPELGSEDGNGWHLVNQLARVGEIWALTLPVNKAPIERALCHTPLPNVHWVYYDIPAWMRTWHVDRHLERVHYTMWQVGMYRIARKLHDKIKFDVIHHLTWGQYWSATYLSLLDDAQFIWGPLGGGESAPKSFYPSLGPDGLRYERLRDLARTTGHLHPFVRRAAKQADIAIAATKQTEDRLLQLGVDKNRICIQPNAGLPREDFNELVKMPVRKEKPFRLVSIGRLLHWKGFYLGLSAFAKALKDMPESEYWVIGDGPDMDRLRQLVAEEGIADQVKFWGRVPRTQVLECLEQCDVLVHPSLHDAGGWVTMEAMSAGRPVICLELGGPGVQVTSETGYKIPATTPEKSICEMAQAMVSISNDPALKQRMAVAGRNRIESTFVWDRVGDFLASLPPYNP